jgi:hypothetical protein
MDEDLRTGITGGDYKVALFVRIVPSRVTGRRIRPTL